MTNVRQYQGESLEEFSTPRRKVIRYWVPGEVNSNDAIAELKDTTIDRGDADPDGSSLIALRFTATERMGAGSDQGFMVDVEFGATGGTGSFPEIEDQDPAYRLVDLTAEQRRIILPVFKRVKTAFADTLGDAPTIGEEWSREDAEVSQVFQVLRVTCNVPRASYIGYNFDQNIAPQINKIHSLYASSTGLNKWRFIGANASQVNGDVFRITYEWEQDRGTDQLEIRDGATLISDSGEVTTSAPYLVPPVRDAYHDYVTRTEDLPGPIASGTTFNPVIEVMRVYSEALTGANAFLGDPKAAL